MTQKKKVTSGCRPNVAEPPSLAVAIRRQTVEENRHYRDALQILLTELIRQQLASGEKENERK